MSRLRILLATVLGVAVFAFAFGHAAAGVLDSACDGTTGDGNGADSAVCADDRGGDPIEGNSLYGPDGIITKATHIIAIIIGIAAVIVIIVAGIQYMLSTGEPAKVNTAKNAILYAVIGVLVALLAEGIARFVIEQIGT